jgi:hypothetical protein
MLIDLFPLKGLAVERPEWLNLSMALDSYQFKAVFSDL